MVSVSLVYQVLKMHIRKPSSILLAQFSNQQLPQSCTAHVSFLFCQQTPAGQAAKQKSCHRAPPVTAEKENCTEKSCSSQLLLLLPKPARYVDCVTPVKGKLALSRADAVPAVLPVDNSELCHQLLQSLCACQQRSFFWQQQLKA